jgi:eukaryotic-like serine/threonine-protein kinase
MQKDSHRRYASVDQFSEDIGRHLRGLPVAARRDTARYRAAKFIRRNRIGVITAAAVLLSLVAGLATTMWQAREAQTERVRAERRFAEVRTLATSFLFELHDAIADLPGSTPARALLVKRALTSLDGLARESQGDPSLQRDLAAAYERVGRVQGNSYNSNLGDTQGALVSYRKSLAIREQLAHDNPESLELQSELASGYSGLADMNSGVGELAMAAKGYRRAIAIRQKLRAKNPADEPNRVAIAEAYNFLGDTQGMDGYANLGDVPGALESYRQSVKVREELLAGSPKSVEYNVGLANSLMNLGYLASVVGDTSGAVHVRRSVAILEGVTAANPNDATRKLELLSGYARLRSVLAEAGQLDDAIATDSKTVMMLGQMLSADPSNNLLRRNLGAMINWLGRDQRSAGESALAVSSHRKALDIAEKLAAGDSKSTEHRHDVAFSHYLLAEALSDMKDDSHALSEYNVAAEQKEKLRAIEPTNTRHADDLALIYTGTANVLTREGRVSQARAAIEQAIPLAEATAARSATNRKAKVNLALTYFAAGRLHESMTKGIMNHGDLLAQWRETRALFTKSSDIFQKLDAQRHLSVAQAKTLADTAHEIAKCDEALAGV